MSEEKFSKCEEGKKNVSVEFRVFGKKMEIEGKSSGEKSKCSFLCMKDFARFVFTGWVLYSFAS